MAGNAEQRSIPLSLPEYALKSRETSRLSDSPSAIYSLRFGFFGEIGGLLSSVKKAERDRLVDTHNHVAAEELGDALWYLFAVASIVKIDPNDLGSYCLSVLRKRFDEIIEVPIITPISFHQIDSLIGSYSGRGI